MPTSPSSKTLVVITMGDPAGIGAETVLRSLKNIGFKKNVSFLIIGDIFILRREARRLRIKMPDADIVDLGNVPRRNFKYGVVRGGFGKAALEYIDIACEIIMGIRNKRPVALVTAPVSKEAIRRSCPGFSGHTEYLAKFFKARFVTMFMVSRALKVALVTRHIPFSSVAKSITKEKIIKTADQAHEVLKDIFKIKSPRIGVASLNPHAGEGGIFGREEKNIINPAVLRLKKRIPRVEGPGPADTLFYKARNGRLDAVISMYHDQALIPFKTLSFESGVNMTLGLPFIRTSPDHGTAFDIAGRRFADPTSMTEAIKIAISSARRKGV